MTYRRGRVRVPGTQDIAPRGVDVDKRAGVRVRGAAIELVARSDGADGRLGGGGEAGGVVAAAAGGDGDEDPRAHQRGGRRVQRRRVRAAQRDVGHGAAGAPGPRPRVRRHEVQTLDHARCASAAGAGQDLGLGSTQGVSVSVGLVCLPRHGEVCNHVEPKREKH